TGPPPAPPSVARGPLGRYHSTIATPTPNRCFAPAHEKSPRGVTRGPARGFGGASAAAGPHLARRRAGRGTGVARGAEVGRPAGRGGRRHLVVYPVRGGQLRPLEVNRAERRGRVDPRDVPLEHVAV